MCRGSKLEDYPAKILRVVSLKFNGCLLAFITAWLFRTYFTYEIMSRFLCLNKSRLCFFFDSCSNSTIRLSLSFSYHNSAMGRRKQKHQHQLKGQGHSATQSSVPYHTNQQNYEPIEKHNELFVKFYKGLNLMPESEWDNFYKQLKEPLPVVFRITGFRSQAKELLRIIRTDFIDNLVKRVDAAVADSIKKEVTDDMEQTADNSEKTDAVAPGNGRDAEWKSIKLESIKPPRCLTWYPDELAWQIDLSRKAVRSLDILSQLHDFLIYETETGNISRQEAVSMIPPLVLDVQNDSRVLDMCAAPGSKTAQLIELLHKDEHRIPEGFVVANDRENKRCYLMVHQLKRLTSPCCMIVNHDATFFPKILTDSENEEQKFASFDRVLADVPCSGDGTLRKNLDVWRKWTPINGCSMHHLQIRIVKRGLELLEVGGRLVYSTCSMHPAEDEAVIAEVLRRCQGAVELVDVTSYLPGLKYVPGLKNWQMMDKDGNWVKSFENQLFSKFTFTKSMFPPTDDENEKFNLHRCMRVLPHHQDTGGFFIAALQKVQDLPWSRDANLLKEPGLKQELDSDAVVSSIEFPTVDSSNASNLAVSVKRVRDSEAENSLQPNKKLKGYKEDPFLFLEQDDPVYPPIRDFYGLSEDFPATQLLYRSKEGGKRGLYFVSKAIKNIVTCNRDRIRFINMGVKMVSRSPSPMVPDCDYRLVQEGIGTMRDMFPKRLVYIPRQDVITILTHENPYLCKLTEATQEVLSKVSCGSLIFVFKPSDSEPEPDCEVSFVGWRGRTSVRSFVPRFERQHSLRMFGEDLNKFNEQVRLMKEQKQKEQAAENTNDSIDKIVDDTVEGTS